MNANYFGVLDGFSGVVPASQTEESEVANFPGRSPELVPGRPFKCWRAFISKNQLWVPSPKVREPHFLRFGLPEPFLRFCALPKSAGRQDFPTDPSVLKILLHSNPLYFI